MESGKVLADRFREILLHGDWVVATNYKEQISDLNWKQATTKISTLNTIAALCFHINYYLAGVLHVFEGGALEIRDKYSFDFPSIESEEDWQELSNTLLTNAEAFANLLERMPEKKLKGVFVDRKYGTYRRNINVMIEHSYYHLGQIVMIKKIIVEREKK